MPLFADANQTYLVAIAVIVVVTWMLLMRSQRYFGRQRGGGAEEPRQSGPAAKPPAAGGELPEALARWEVEMHETARKLAAQLDSKMSALQALIADADRAAARLEAAQRGEMQTSPPVDNPPASLPLPSEARRDEIYTLADYGFTPAEIARRIDAPVGEVESVLALRAKK